MTRRQDRPIRVLIVEDSRTQRELLVRLLEASGSFEIVGTATNGQEGIEATRTLRPDVVAMDIHLPVLDGYEATRQIMQCCPTPIVMVSNSIGPEGRRSVEALAAGALAVIRKPGSMLHENFEEMRLNLITTLRLMADVPVITRHAARPTPPARVRQPVVSTRATQLLAIAASTGGPAAVQTVLAGLGANFPLPVLVVQHISLGFVDALVDWLNTTIPLHVQVARHNEQMRPGTVYLAPDNHHLLAAELGTIGLQLNGPLDRFCPSADLLFQSVAEVYQSTAIGVILTGMGDDGAKGLYQLRQQGSYTLGQDEASCVVYGMPQAAADAGAVVRVERLATMAQAILNHIRQYEPASTEGQ